MEPPPDAREEAARRRASSLAVSAAPAGRGSDRAIVAVAALGTMLLPLNSTMVAVALPDIVRGLDASVATSAWLVSGYLIAQASLQPLSGKLGDRLGRRPLIVCGLASFGAASLGAALAPTFAVLIVFRVLQAAAGALVFPNALGLIRELLPEHRRGRAFGMLGSAIGVAAAVGPPLGGALVALGGWRAIFLVNLPWIAVALWLTHRTVPRRVAVERRARFDTAGAVALTVLLAGFAWLLNPGEAAGWLLPLGAVVLAGGVAAFLRYEVGREDPVLQPRFLRVRAFAAATGAVGLGNVALYGTLLAVPVLLTHRGGWSDAEIGLAVAAMSVPMAALSPIGGRLADSGGRRGAAVVGLGVLAVALGPLAVAGSSVAAPVLIGSLALAGAGLGLSNAAVQAAGIEALDARDAGIAAGIFSTGRYLGGIAAASLVAALASGPDDRFGLLFGIEVVAAIAATILATALPGPLVMRSARPSAAR
jgi:EmrB/QacA subfamily drug resistance transporter